MYFFEGMSGQSFNQLPIQDNGWVNTTFYFTNFIRPAIISNLDGLIFWVSGGLIKNPNGAFFSQIIYHMAIRLQMRGIDLK